MAALGPPGPPGPQGPPGRDGKDGKDGRDGRDGKDAGASIWRFEFIRDEQGFTLEVIATPIPYK